MKVTVAQYSSNVVNCAELQENHCAISKTKKNIGSRRFTDTGYSDGVHLEKEQTFHLYYVLISLITPASSALCLGTTMANNQWKADIHGANNAK